MSLESAIKKHYSKVEQGGQLSEADALDLDFELRRFWVLSKPNTLSQSRFEGSGTTPASSVPLTAEGIKGAVERASAAEDAKAKATAQLWGKAASIAIAAGVTFLTGGTLSPAVATSIVAQLGPTLNN